MQNQSTSKTNVNFKTKDLVITSLLIALVFAFTYIKVPSPFSLNSGGLIHLGNIMLFMSAILFGKKKGAIAGAFGMGLFDITSGYAIWAPFTFIIRGVMGFIIGYFAHAHGRKGKNIKWNVIGIILASIIMVPGYFATNIILYNNVPAAISSISGDVTQLVVGIALGLPAANIMIKTKALDNYIN